MKKWKLFIKDNLKQLFIVLSFRLIVIASIVIFGLYFISEIGIEIYMLMGIYTLLILMFVIGTKETIVNINQELQKYNKDYINLDNLDS